MKIFNVMNFVRACDERDENYKENLFNVTKKELELVNEFDIENTFLLQYDALCDERYVELFKEKATSKTELGVWLEIVEPMTNACGLPYKSQNNWKWDWHIIPGLPMGYVKEERKLLLDETMRKFKETFGYYPKTIGGWLIDSFTMNYLSQNYQIDAFCICRDQVNTDAYTLIGGYFEGAYYPSKKNIFTPAQSVNNQVNVPVFRLLGPCPIFNYDNERFMLENERYGENVFTLEPAWRMGSSKKCVEWFFKTYFENENLGFHSLQLGQENSFTDAHILPNLCMQLEVAKKLVSDGKAEFKKYSDTGRIFKDTYKETPANSVAALENWNMADVQSVYYYCKRYVANIFRNGKTVFIRALYLFDDRNIDKYITEKCQRFDAVYENLPVIDTVIWQKNKQDKIGLVIDENSEVFEVKPQNGDELTVSWKDKKIVFVEDGIEFKGCGKLSFDTDGSTAKINQDGNRLLYSYNGYDYAVSFENAELSFDKTTVYITGDNIDVKF